PTEVPGAREAPFFPSTSETPIVPSPVTRSLVPSGERAGFSQQRASPIGSWRSPDPSGFISSIASSRGIALGGAFVTITSRPASPVDTSDGEPLGLGPSDTGDEVGHAVARTARIARTIRALVIAPP